MANPYFATIGDVWKHLCVTEAVEVLRLDEYWESHAGSAWYRLRPDKARKLGVLHFLDSAVQTTSLAESSYYKSVAAARLRAVYPGSASLVMHLTLQRDTTYSLCDVEEADILSLRAEARQLGILGRLDARCLDGIEHFLHVTEERGGPLDGTFLFIDPFDVTDVSVNGRTSLDLFMQAAAAGAIVGLWYSYRSHTGQLAPFVNYGQHAGRSLWIGDLLLSPPLAAEALPGRTIGLGLALANVGEALGERLARLGQLLASTYAAEFGETAVRFSSRSK